MAVIFRCIFQKYGIGLQKFQYDPDAIHALYKIDGQLVERTLQMQKYDVIYESFNLDAGYGHKLVLVSMGVITFHYSNTRI